MKKYVIKTFKPGSSDHKHINPLLNLSNLGINNNATIMKTSMALSISQTTEGTMADQSYPTLYDALGQNKFSKYRDLTKNQTNNYAFFDQSYQQRKMYCQQMARDNDVNFILDTITNEAIVPDSNGMVATLDLDRLKMFLNKSYKREKTDKQGIKETSNSDSLIHDCTVSYNIVYSALGWEQNNGAFDTFKKYLVEGHITLEILIDMTAKIVTGFLELDPATLEPAIETTEDGEEIFVWYQYRGESRQRMIPDSNIIYITWNNGSSRINNISYVETLTRAFNMLKQTENSHMVWNIMNAQKHVKITVPVGDLAPNRAQERISEIMADYSEEVSIDSMSGQVLVQGEPNINYQKTYVFEDRGGSAVSMDALDLGGYDVGVEAMQYYWRKFILESQVPGNRFMLNVNSTPNNNMLGDSAITREEYAFGRFVQRIQSNFKEILLKPLWVQLCLKHEELSKIDYLRQGLGIKFGVENMFALAKERSLIAEGANTISTLMGIQDANGKPYFSVEFAIKKYLGLSDQDLELNQKYKEAEILRQLEVAKLQKKLQGDVNQNAGGDMNEGGFGGGGFGGGDMGGGFGDMGGGDMGGGFGGGDTGGGFGDLGGGDMGGGGEMAAPEPAPEAAPPAE